MGIMRKQALFQKDPKKQPEKADIRINGAHLDVLFLFI
jgi:hypothetical protein